MQVSFGWDFSFCGTQLEQAEGKRFIKWPAINPGSFLLCARCICAAVMISIIALSLQHIFCLLLDAIINLYGLLSRVRLRRLALFVCLAAGNYRRFGAPTEVDLIQLPWLASINLTRRTLWPVNACTQAAGLTFCLRLSEINLRLSSKQSENISLESKKNFSLIMVRRHGQA